MEHRDASEIKYLLDKNIPEIIDALMGKLLEERPENPLAFMRQEVGVLSAKALEKEYVEFIYEQYKKCLENPQKIIDTTLSKRSSFKFQRTNDNCEVNIDIDIGSCCVALPNEDTDFGRRFVAMVDQIQDVCKQYMPTATKRQTMPHMSIGSVILDKESPAEYNAASKHRSGLLANTKTLLDKLDPPLSARIQHLKLNSDGCLTLQLESDPSQDIVLTEKQLEKALAKVPTCNTPEALANEKRKFQRAEDGGCIVSRLQQVRLALGAMGCEIKGFWPAGHMVVVNFVDPAVMGKMPEEEIREMFAKLFAIWQPLSTEWFTLANCVSLVYLERSLNEASTVVAPPPGQQPKAFPKDNESAQLLMDGLFWASPEGDIFLNEECYNRRLEDPGHAMWKAFRAEVREMAENQANV
jgi:hypothetical protein|uniref:Uncharacterized protein n=1 Tax=Eutreptiella gymnastica TaxID=73025 RepID=A0A7S4CSZ7_9EUGL